MKFSYNWLKEYLSEAPEPQQLADDLMMRAFEVESVEKRKNDWVLEIKILPNRAFDCLSYLGIAREIAAIAKIKFVEPRFELKEEPELKAKDFLRVEIKDAKLCPRYSARVMLDVKVGESPPRLKEKLEACGLRPINNIVDITNFVMLECGQPLHAFDLDKMTPTGVIPSEARDPELRQPSTGLFRSARNDKCLIIVRRAQKEEKILTLDESRAERILNETILVIADAQKAIAIAGVKGGRGTEIDGKTTRVVLEAANFNPVSIRRSSKALGLRTDASSRFENGVDSNLTVFALNRAAALISELAGGKVADGIVDVSFASHGPCLVTLSHKYLESLLGVKIDSKTVLDILSRLDLPAKILQKNNEIFYEVLVPSRRNDLQTSEDLIEEIGRLYGYENISASMPEGVLLPALRGEDLIMSEEIRNIMAGLGHFEVYNYSFISENEKTAFHFQNLAEVINPLSQEQKYLRPNMSAGLLKNLKENLRHWHTAHSRGRALRLFEIGNVFWRQPAGIVEAPKIGGLVYLTGNAKNQAFYEAKGVLEILLNKLALSDVWEDNHLQDGMPSNWDFVFNHQKTAQLKVGQKLLGWLGVVNQQLLDDLEIAGEPVIFEIDFIKLVELVGEERSYQSPSKYPAVIRDLALLVPAETKIEEVLNILEETGGELLQDTDLFDIYEGEDLADEQKSLAFHLIFQSNERNLSEVEVNKLMEKIITAAETEGWETRK
jgi:phenylalanyl-tRNA synthetase beta chain